MSSLIDQYSKEELEEIIKNSFSYAEVLSKLGYSTKNGSNHKTLKRRIEYHQISTEHFSCGHAKTNWTDEEIFCENSKVSQNKLRHTFKDKMYVPYQCAVCGLPPFWNNQPLVLTLDHINGKNKDNRIENLRWVCPNCDRQSNTYGSKNKKKLEKGVILAFGNYEKKNNSQNNQKQQRKQNEECANEDLNIATLSEVTLDNCNSAMQTNRLELPERGKLKAKLWELKNYTQVANYFNVSSTQIRRWCRQYDLPATIDIVKYTSEVGWINENWNDIERRSFQNLTPSKPCYMIDKESGQVLMEFSSRREAGRYIAPGQKKAEIHIGKVCKGERKSAYGYFWRDKEEVAS